jgi:p-cumate 2,3-dioxygenase alpha subunit
MKIDDLVIDDSDNGIFRVHRSTMTSQEIFDLEREAIIENCWLYLGHESEVEAPGDFVSRTVMGRPLIMVKDESGSVNAIYNTCTHRGATLCREERGHSRFFTCFYHAWSFNSSGELVTLPDEASYGPRFDRAERTLQRPAKLEQYRGFWFVAFNSNVMSLSDYLAEAKEFIDLVVDQAREGMRLIEGSNIYATRANWKLLVENSLDGYHAFPVHQTYFNYVKSLGGGMKTPTINGVPTRDLGNGHAVIEAEAPYGRPIARWDDLFGEDAREEIATLRAGIVEKYGEQRAWRMCDTIRNLSIFPNLIINDITAITIRYMEPIAPDRYETRAWALAPKEESGASLQRRIDSYLTFIGPGGFATPDDVEALESCQRGFQTLPDAAWSDISRGMTTEEPSLMDEYQMRTFWRAWRAMMAGRYPPQHVETPETVVRVAERTKASL